jgi:hypothetical protein
MVKDENSREEAPRSFQDVVLLLEADQTLTPTGRRDMISALRSMARMIKRPLDQTPANTDWLRQRLNQLHPTQIGISAKRFSNIKSAALAALRRTGAKTKRRDWLDPMSPDWSTLFEAVPNKLDRYKLSRLFRWATTEGLAPRHLNDAAIADFTEMLVSETFVKDPHKIVRQAVNLWNKMSGAIPGWPQSELARPLKRAPWTFPLAAFPESFQADVDRWCARLTLDDLFAEDAPIRPCRPATIKHRRMQNFKRAIGFIRKRNGDKSTEALFGLATGLKAIARHHVKVDETHLNQLKRICARLDQTADRTRRRNRDRLEQFEDKANLARLLNLPEHLANKAQAAGFRSRRAALWMQTAVAIELLLFCPMRVGNLAALDLDRHMRWRTVNRRKILLISIPAVEVKNGVPLNYELVGSSAALVRAYLDQARPQLLGAPSTALFPKLNGAAKQPGDLSTQIRRTIFEESGLVVNAHLFRSIAARIHNMIAAGDFGTVAHVLSDRIGTVMKAYANHEQTSSLRRYQDSVVRLRTAPLDVGRDADDLSWRPQ